MGNESQPFLLTGLSSSSSVSVTCTGLPAGETMASVQASPLAVVTQPFSLTLLGSEADLDTASLGSANGSGVYTSSLTLGTTGAGTFHGGGSLAGTTFAPDPNATCPPSQAQINAGLVTCVMAIDDVTATTAPSATPSQADFAGLALLDFSGQATPQVPPTISFNPPLAARSLGHRHRRRCGHLMVGRRLVGRRVPEQRPHRRSVHHPGVERPGKREAGHFVLGASQSGRVLLLRRNRDLL